MLAPGGRLIIGTPDYARWEWRVTEAAYRRAFPGACADEHISHFARDEPGRPYGCGEWGPALRGNGSKTRMTPKRADRG